MNPKSTLKIPLKNLGLLNKTTFTKKTSRENNQHRLPEKPRIITHIASTATRNFGGQKQLMRSPQANVRPISPLLQPQPLCLRISHPSDISALRRLLITVYQKSGKNATIVRLRPIFFIGASLRRKTAFYNRDATPRFIGELLRRVLPLRLPFR